MNNKEGDMFRSPRYRVGVDIGGTFTDIVLIGSDGSIRTKKASSTPDDYSLGIICGLQEIFREIGVLAGNVDGVVHATTVAANAILEGKGAKTGLITTEGFRDVLTLRRIRIPQLYNLNYEKPTPLVPRRWRFEVEERMGPKGEVRKPLNGASVKAVAAKLRDAGIEALAICLLHSYANPEHEQRVAEIVRDVLPDSVYITCSHEILPEIREYERTSTTVINAYLGPLVRHYLSSLRDRLLDINVHAPLHIMQSNGGVMTADAAMIKPAYIVESGPAAGVVAAARVAKMAGYNDVITLDMGGTTAKTALIEAGKPAKTTEYEVGAGINLSSRLSKGAGYAMKLPFIDVGEIGAGGGSIVRLDEGGLLQVGPESAGAVPGPVCYDTGGKQPTLTDALVILGYINPEYLVGGALLLNANKSRDVFEELVAKPLGKPILEAAYGVYTIAASNMVRAVKAVSTYRGRDPRNFVLFTFGGNGPVLGLEVARSLEMRHVLIPPSPGVFSALGLLFCDIEHEVIQTLFRKVKELMPQELEAAYARLEEGLQKVFTEEGLGADRIVVSRFADLRYCNQAYELTVPVDGGQVGLLDLDRIVDAFGVEHERTYGHRADVDPVEFVNISVVGQAAVSGPKVYDPMAAIDAGCGNGRIGPRERMAYFGPAFGLLRTPVAVRHALVGRCMDGPLIIEEYDATCVIPPGCNATVDSWGNIDIHLEN